MGASYEVLLYINFDFHEMWAIFEGRGETKAKYNNLHKGAIRSMRLHIE
jgi:hypothetical protein